MELQQIIQNDSILKELYPQDQKDLNQQRERYENLISNFKKNFSSKPEYLFSSPGRTEICGNHTDHNNGKVIAAGIDLDIIAAVEPIDENKIRIISEEFEPIFEVSIDNLDPQSSEEESTNALIRGIANKFEDKGYKIGGFNAFLSSQVGVGSGLSSSAAIEIMIGTILNSVYNSNNISASEIARIGQYAENVYFGKPCGLMDQLAIARGGLLKIDFREEKPNVKQLDFTQKDFDFDIVIVNTGGTHADLTEDYSAIPREMEEVAREFDETVLREVNKKEFINKIPLLCENISDRSILRSIHYFKENERVEALEETIEAGNYNEFLEIIQKSGDSSFKYLQNCFTPKMTTEQGISLSLALTDEFMDNGIKGAARVHGGGFAGTIQVFIEKSKTKEYQDFIEEFFGKDSSTKLNVRSHGGVRLDELKAIINKD